MPHHMPINSGIASRHLDGRRFSSAMPNREGMDARQKPVAEWMQSVIARRNISARAWAEKAGLGKDTVSRAIRADFASVTSTRTIAQLAGAIGERPYGAAAAVPSETSLTAVLEVLLEALVPDRKIGPDLLTVFAASLRDTLLHLADEPDDADDPRTSRALARVLVRRSSPTGA
jgi:hypothetical protein